MRRYAGHIIHIQQITLGRFQLLIVLTHRGAGSAPPDRPYHPSRGGNSWPLPVTDAISSVTLSLALLPLAAPIIDAKVLTGKQKPLTEIALLFAEIRAESGRQGVGYSYANGREALVSTPTPSRSLPSSLARTPATSSGSGPSWSKPMPGGRTR